MLFARQAIFDRVGRTVGYELLYRSESDLGAATSSDLEYMTSRVLVDAVLDVRFKGTLDGQPAYFNVPRAHLLGGVVELLDPTSVVVELLESIPADDAVIAACRRLRRAGYRLALDDYVGGDPRAPLLEFVDLVKVDVLAQPVAELAQLVRGLRGRTQLLAEKVEDAAMHRRCEDLGFDLFQGFFFTRPQIVRGRGLAPDLLHTLTLMNLLRDPAVPQSDIVESFRSDADLTLRLVRMANAAAVGVREVSSIPHAISLLGRGPLHQWLALVFAASSANWTPIRSELLRSTLTRARFCELLGEHARERDPGEAFLVGLFSRIEPLLETPLPEILAHVRLAPSVVQALTDGSGPIAWALQLAEAHEVADWDRSLALARAHAISPAAVSDLYLDALDWTRGALEALT